MHRNHVKWYSPSLHRDMELLVFGHGGFPVLAFPTSYGRFYEYEDRGMVNAAGHKIERGELTLICVDSVDQESWYNRGARPADRLHRQNAYDAYLALEVYPFARNLAGWGQVGTTGCSFGGYHAINFALRHPDMVTYAVSLSGAFKVPRQFLNGFYNDDAYFHCPPDYLPNQTDDWYLSRYRSNYYVLACGQDDPQKGENFHMAHLMGVKQIPHCLDIWDGFGHDWPWWYRMTQKFL